jgi:hypothetical protein
LDGIGALISEDAEEIEDERDDLDEVSETIDSGDDIEETELANEDRRWETYDCGEEVCCHLSVYWAAQTFEACAIAKLSDGLPSNKEAPLTAGVLNPMLWGVNLGVGNKPRAGAGLLGG